jgi:hypothetical protein
MLPSKNQAAAKYPGRARDDRTTVVDEPRKLVSNDCGLYSEEVGDRGEPSHTQRGECRRRGSGNTRAHVG